MGIMGSGKGKRKGRMRGPGSGGSLPKGLSDLFGGMN
jgi:hypothetical protein